MNKQEFIAIEIEKNKEKFGKWHSTSKRNSADEKKLFLNSPPKNKEEASQHGNALASTGYYPFGTSDCFNVGISGGCGVDCFVFVDGQCGDPQEFKKEHIIEFHGANEAKEILEQYPCFSEDKE